MSSTPKKKLCWNCDGNVPIKAEHCPYCGVYIEQANDFDEEDEREETLPAPPYAMPSSTRHTNGEAPAPPYALPKKNQADPSKSKAKQKPQNPASRVVVAISLLAAGSVFLLFGLVLFLFSENGVFTLSWNGDHWPVYLILGPVFLILGWRLVGHFDDSVA